MSVKDQLLIKRFNTLVGKLPIPRFKSKVSLEAYQSVFELDEEVTVEHVKQALSGFQLHLSDTDYREYQQLEDIDKYLFVLDNVEEARNHCKRFYKKEGSDPLHHHVLK